MSNHSNAGVRERLSADATLKKDDSYSASRNKFYSSTSAAENGKMLMTGMSAFNANNHMMLAKNNLKMMTHQQQSIHARIIKLAKEEEKANKRIKDAQRKANFVADMHQVKNEKMNMKQQMLNELKAKEDANRIRINEHRAKTKASITQNKLSVFQENKGTRSDIKL